MSAVSPSYAAPVPSVNKDPDSLVQAVQALKQNVELLQGTREIRRPVIYYSSLVNTQTGAALSRVRRALIP